MSNSPLVVYTALSPNHSGRRNQPITKITPHYTAGNCSIETCGEIFRPTSRQASSNYGIGSDGRVGMYVEECNRAWTSGSSWNDNRAVTIECANLADGSLTDACWNALVELCADICRRNGIKDCSYTGNTDGVLTMHCWFQATDCPGPWLSKQFARLSKEVNERLAGGAPTPAQKPSTTLASGYHKDKDFAGTYRCTVDYLRVRRAPSLSGTEVAHYSTGETVDLEGYWWRADGYIWGTYIGDSGNRNYIAVGKATGKVEPDDYLIQV